VTRRLRALGLTLLLAACQEGRESAVPASFPDTTVPGTAVVAGPWIDLAEVTEEIERVLASGRANQLPSSDFTRHRGAVARLYGPDGRAPLWTDGRGHPSAAGREAVAILRLAADDGLDPALYGGAILEAMADALAGDPAPDPTVVGGFDAALSVAMVRFATHLHAGRVDPRRIGFRLTLPPEGHDIPVLIRTALTDGRLTELIEELRPPMVLYRRLRETLAAYRVMAEREETLPLPTPAASVRPGEPYPALPVLAARLHLLADLRDPPTAASDTLEGPVLEALRRFQSRHGLAPDGILGRATLAALNVPLAHRVVQLELSLERLRWLPDLTRGRFIAVNIPTFHLWAWDSVSADGAPTLGMNVIVGQAALNTRTPVFVEEMRYVIFRPYWNVPPGILRNEVLPAIRSDSTYLRRNDMEIVLGPGDDAVPVAETEENLTLLAEGRLRVRQRPGPGNALGLVKFMFPNDENVYLHDTPAPELFSRARRDFSHGCVRIERPVDLAVWALRDVPGWNRDRIAGAMRDGHSTRVNLRTPVPVLLFYTTAIVQPDGTPQFFADVYEHDARLELALRDGRER
jgi:L,D-transpeptidase YcbB